MPELEFKSLNTLLDELEGQTLKGIAEEFKELLKNGLTDSTGFIKEVSQDTARWLEMLGNGQLTQKEVDFLMKQQKKHAQIFANTQSIIIKSKVQKIIYRLLDISIDVLSGALVVV